MKNPWTSKNPLLSMWLSGANALLSIARGQAAAHANRQMKSMSRATAKEIAELWGGARAGGRKPKRPR